MPGLPNIKIYQVCARRRYGAAGGIHKRTNMGTWRKKAARPTRDGAHIHCFASFCYSSPCKSATNPGPGLCGFESRRFHHRIGATASGKRRQRPAILRICAGAGRAAWRDCSPPRGCISPARAALSPCQGACPPGARSIRISYRGRPPVAHARNDSRRRARSKAGYFGGDGSARCARKRGDSYRRGFPRAAGSIPAPPSRS